MVVSEAVARTVRPYAGGKPVLVAYNGVAAHVETRRRDAAPIVGTIGTVCRTKGTDVFLEAAALARQSRPELAFEHIGQTGLDEDVEFEQRVSGLAGAATMLGRRAAVDGLDRWELFVLASRQDAFPLATIEAMAAGVPVIATRVGGLPEQIEHLETGVLVEPENPSVLADWIVRLHDDPGLREKLAAAAATLSGSDSRSSDRPTCSTRRISPR